MTYFCIIRLIYISYLTINIQGLLTNFLFLSKIFKQIENNSNGIERNLI